MADPSGKRVVTAALVGNALVTVTKFAAALITGSSAMMSESVHTLADTGNELLLLDGVASIAIGVLLGLIALVLASETKSLLIGEPADSELVSSICRMAREQPGVERSNGLFTVHLGPQQVVAALSIELDDRLTAGQVEAMVASLEDRVRKRHPEVVSLLVKPQPSERADFRLAPAEDET
jgi:divalent metal cation (Fe/Co/Zn/Cd) transporter